MINIDKLHKFVSVINTGVRWTSHGSSRIRGSIRRTTVESKRSQGISEAYVELMVGEVLLGDPGNQYLYVGETARMAELAVTRLVERLKEEQITPLNSWRDRIMLDNGMTFVAVGAGQLTDYHYIRGLQFHRVFSDVDLRERSVDFVKRFRGELYPALINGEGDIV